MSYVNLDPNFFEHPKTRRLVGLLGPMSEVLPIRLWAYCAKMHPRDGRMTDYTEAEIKGVLGVPEANGISTVTAMIRVGFLERTDSGFVCVDWKQHQGHIWALKKRNAHAAKTRWKNLREKSKTKRVARPKTLESVYSDSVNPSMRDAMPNTDSRMPLSVPCRALPSQLKEKTTDIAVPAKPKTPIQRIVEAYKHAKGVPMDDKGWDRSNFGRYSKAAKSLLECFKGDVDLTAAYIFTRATELDEKSISWTLETITRHAWDGEGIAKEPHGPDDKPVESNRILGQGRNRGTTSSRAIVGDTLRAIEATAVHAKEAADVGGHDDDPFGGGEVV